MAGVDDEQKAKDLYRRYSANPWFLAGFNLYKRFASAKGYVWCILSRWNGFIKRCFARISVFALAFLLICVTTFAPIDTRGWSSVKRAYALTGVEEGVIIGALLLLTGSFVASQSGNVDYAGIAEDFGSWASDSLKNTVWENGSEWVNPTASGTGYTVDISQVPDSVLKGVIDYGAHLGSSDNVSAGVLPSSVSPTQVASIDEKVYLYNIAFADSFRNIVQSKISELPYLFVAVKVNGNDRNSRYVSMYLTDMPLTYRVDTSNKRALVISYPSGVQLEQYTQSFTFSGTTASLTFNGVKSSLTGSSVGGTDSRILTYSNAISVWQTALYTAAPIAEGVPAAISSPIEAYQADPTDENAQSAIDAIRAANPSVTLPEEAPQVVNNYNEYVTVNNGSGEVADPDVPSDFDLTGLADAIADALGGGATIASVLAALRSMLDGMVTSDALSGEFAGVGELLQQLINLEQRAEQWRQQQELNADLDEIIDLLTSIDENVGGILQDMANLDRSTGDLVNLQPVIDAINGLQLPGDPVATDLSNLEHQLLDMTDEDGLTLTVHGLLHWIHYYLQDVDRLLHDWDPVRTNDYSAVLGNIYDEISAFTDSFAQFWEDFDNYLDAVLWDLEHLQLAPRTPSTPYSTPLPDPGTGIVKWEDELNLNALRDAVTRLMQKFPFVTINNFVLILTMLVRPAQAPQFDLPLPNPSDWSEPYLVHVDLSIWDVPAAILRTGTMLWAIARVSRRTVALWTREEGGGEGA